jgi:hypothetical protein
VKRPERSVRGKKITRYRHRRSTMSPSTRKPNPEDPGGLERQHKRQRRWSVGKVAPFAVTAAIGLAAVAASISGALRGPNPTTSANETPTVARGTSPEPQPGVGPVESALIGRRELTVGGVPLTFSVTMGGWERFGRISINKSTVGSQGAEAIIFWTRFPDGEYADPCADLISPPVDPSAADLAVAVSKAPGTELVRGPSDVTVGGRAAKHVVLTVREDVGCDPGFFYAWQDVEEGALWPMTDVGDTIRVWILDVGGTRLFIEAETTKQAGSDLEQEIRQIVESIRFD